MSNTTNQIAEWVKSGEEFSRMDFENFERQYPQQAAELLVQCDKDLERAANDKSIRTKADGITYGVSKDKFTNKYVVWRNKAGTMDKPKSNYSGGKKGTFQKYAKAKLKEYRCGTLTQMTKFIADDALVNPTNKWSHIQIIPAGFDDDQNMKEPYAVIALYETL